MAQRRLNGEGSLRKRSDGRWELRLAEGYKDNGYPKYKSFYGRTRREVQDKLKAYQEDKRNGIDLSRSYTFDEWSEVWFEYHKSNITPTTQENYRFILKRLKLYLGERYIMDIKPFDIELLLKAERAEGYSDSHLSSCRGLLYQIFRKAAANDLVRKNPVEYAEKMRASDDNKRKEAFTAEEVRLLMEQLPNDKIGMSIRLMLGTGMRTQELLALEPHHIEKGGSVLHIRQAVNLVKGTVHVGKPKSRDSVRDIPVPPNLRWCAKELRKVETKFIFEKRKPNTPCNPTSFRDDFQKAISKIKGVRVLTPHSCRHTYVSQMQALGVDLSTIQSIVGHADTDMTQHYLHVQDAIRQEAVRKFAEAFPLQTENSPEPTPPVGNIIPFPNVG